MMNLKNCINFLLREGYMTLVSNNYMLTNKLTRELNPSLISVKKERENNPQIELSHKELYKHFIKEAQVPWRLPLGNGRAYTANAYGKSGEKEFIKALKIKDVSFKSLVETTKSYYKARISNKVTVNNFFTEGIWESEHERYLTKLKGQIPMDDDSNTLDV